jgi:LETM1 and EF-hand domain-containing protein 1, mitochondrial
MLILFRVPFSPFFDDCCCWVVAISHYWMGTKLLVYEFSVAAGLLGKLVQGHELTRRERRQLTRSAADLLRFVITHSTTLHYTTLPSPLRLTWRPMVVWLFADASHVLNHLLRLVPLAFFVVVPLAEFLLPFALKLFPNILPSTFQEKHKIVCAVLLQHSHQWLFVLTTLLCANL